MEHLTLFVSRLCLHAMCGERCRILFKLTVKLEGEQKFGVSAFKSTFQRGGKNRRKHAHLTGTLKKICGNSSPVCGV